MAADTTSPKLPHKSIRAKTRSLLARGDYERATEAPRQVRKGRSHARKLRDLSNIVNTTRIRWLLKHGRIQHAARVETLSTYLTQKESAKIGRTRGLPRLIEWCPTLMAWTEEYAARADNRGGPGTLLFRPRHPTCRHCEPEQDSRTRRRKLSRRLERELPKLLKEHKRSKSFRTINHARLAHRK